MAALGQTQGVRLCVCVRVQVMSSNTDFTFYLECGHCINYDLCSACVHCGSVLYSFKGQRSDQLLRQWDCCERSLPVTNFHLGRGERAEKKERCLVERNKAVTWEGMVGWKKKNQRSSVTDVDLLLIHNVAQDWNLATAGLVALEFCEDIPDQQRLSPLDFGKPLCFSLLLSGDSNFWFWLKWLTNDWTEICRRYPRR